MAVWCYQETVSDTVLPKPLLRNLAKQQVCPHTEMQDRKTGVPDSEAILFTATKSWFLEAILMLTWAQISTQLGKQGLGVQWRCQACRAIGVHDRLCPDRAQHLPLRRVPAPHMLRRAFYAMSGPRSYAGPMQCPVVT
eukprot:3935407-Rhodomonas_salina.1